MVRPTPPRRLAATAAGLVLLGSGLAACGDVTQSNPGGGTTDAAAGTCVPGTTKKIAFMLKQQTAFRYLHADVPFFKEAVEKAGYQVVFQSAENDANKQVAQAENVLTQGVDAIVIQPVDFNVAAGIAQKATAAGVPLASYDDLILGAPHAAFVGRDPKEGGASAAKAVLAEQPTGNYVLIGGDPGQTGSTEMQKGYHEVLDPVVAEGDITIVADQFTPAWKTEPAQATAENALTANRNAVDAFLVSYDGMSLGVLQAIKQAGIPDGKILVTGQDMELSAMQAMAEGRMFGSVWPAPDEMAKRAAQVALDLANCRPVSADTTVDNEAGAVPWARTPIFLVNQEQLGDFVCDHPYWISADEVYQNVPEKKPTC